MIVKLKDAYLTMKSSIMPGRTQLEYKTRVVEWSISMEQYQTLHPFIEGSPFGYKPIIKPIIKVWCPDGIGDLHWVFMKLSGLKRLSSAAEIHLYRQTVSEEEDYYKRGNRSDSFIDMNPLVTKYFKTTQRFPIFPVEGCITNSDGFDYVLNPCPFLESGGHLSDWMPEVPINYDYSMKWPSPKSLPESLKGRVVIYFGDYFTQMTWGGIWTDLMWVELVENIVTKFGEPLVVGLPNDLPKSEVISKLGAKFTSLVGTTSLEKVLQIIFASKVFVGSVSGLSIVAASRGVPTVTLWPDEQSMQKLPTSQRTSWLRSSPQNYCPLGYSVPPIKVFKEVCNLVE